MYVHIFLLFAWSDWLVSARGGPTTPHIMTHHGNHISERGRYVKQGGKAGGVVPWDGVPHRKWFNDIAERSNWNEFQENQDVGTGDPEVAQGGEMHSGALLVLRERPDESIVPSLESPVVLRSDGVWRQANSGGSWAGTGGMEGGAPGGGRIFPDQLPEFGFVGEPAGPGPPHGRLAGLRAGLVASS